MSKFVEHVSGEVWAHTVGTYMLAFGSIESSVNELLRRKCTEATLKFVVTLQLAPRFLLLTEQIGEWALSDANRKVLIDLLGEAKGLSHNRNLIAHNPLVLTFFASDETGARITQAMIRSEHSGKSITHAELLRLTERAEKVALALTKIWVELDLAEMERREPVLQPAR